MAIYVTHTLPLPPRGIACALPTPFRNSQIHYADLLEHLRFLGTAGVQHLVACGTTGEAFALTDTERENICATIRKAAPKAYITMGISALHAAQAIAYAKAAHRKGAHALLLSPPPYVKPDLAGLDIFFREVIAATPLPVILYNHPGRVGFEMPTTFLQKWLAHPQVAGLKEASTDLTRIVMLRTHCPDVLLYGGDDTLFGAFCALGADGLISVGGCVLPTLYMRAWNAYQANDLVAFKASLTALDAFHMTFGTHPNPAGIKALFAEKGWGDGTMRIPQSCLSNQEKDTLIKVAATAAESF